MTGPLWPAASIVSLYSGAYCKTGYPPGPSGGAQRCWTHAVAGRTPA